MAHARDATRRVPPINSLAPTLTKKGRPMPMDFAYWLQVVMILAPVAAGLGILYEKVRQIERRLNGNGDSVPGRCKVHAERLDGLNTRMAVIEEQ